MGVSFCVVFESDVPPHGTLGADHRSLVQRKSWVDRLARDKGLTPLGNFESYEPADASEFLDDDAVAQLPPAQWFSPTAGLAAVREVLTYLRSHRVWVSGQAEVMADLAGIEAELADAERAGVRFRFAIVP